MGIGYAFKQAIQGNFENAFNGVWVPDENLEAIDQSRSNLEKIIARQQADGLVSADDANQLYTEMSPNTNSDAFWQQSGDTPWTVFEDTVEEQASAIGQFGSDAINKTLGLGFKLIPWQVYVLVLVLAMIWAYPIWSPFAKRFLGGKTAA